MNSLVFSNFLHRPVRTLTSIVGIAVGVLLIVFTIGMANGSLRNRGARAGNVGAEIILAYSGQSIISSDTFLFPVSTRDKITEIDGVEKVVAVGANSVRATDNKIGTNIGSRRVEGINFSEYAEMAGIEIVKGKPFRKNADEVVVDTNFLNRKKLNIGDTLPIYKREFTIVGTYEPASGARVKMPLSVMQKQLGGEGKVSSFLVKINKNIKPEQIAEKIQNKFPDNKVLLTSEMEELYMQGFPALNVFLNVVIGIAAAISALVILLTMYTTVTERTKQIGIMKSLGMSNKNIGWIIAQEALLMSFCGVVGGILLAIILKFVLTWLIGLKVELDLLTMGITLIVGLIGGTLGALYPALRASKMDAVEALNYE